MHSRIPLLLMVSALSLLGFGVLAQKTTDRVIKRDGSSVTGHLDSVDETNVTVAGRTIPRSDVAAILFAGTKTTTGPVQSSSNTQPSETNLTDVVVKRIGSSSYGHVSQVTNSLIVQDGSQIPRGRVASIEFNVNNPGHILTTTTPSPTPTPSPSPSASPSPSPSPSPSSEEGGGGKDASGGGNPPSGGARGGDRSRPADNKPPWFGDCGSSAGQIRVTNSWGNYIDYTEEGPTRTVCGLEVTICGKAVHREKVVGRTTREACDQAYAEMKEALGAGTKICCEKLEQARRTKEPGKCDPDKDFDCDEVPNDKDEYPVDPNCSSKNEPCSRRHRTKN